MGTSHYQLRTVLCLFFSSWGKKITRWWFWLPTESSLGCCTLAEQKCTTFPRVLQILSTVRSINGFLPCHPLIIYHPRGHLFLLLKMRSQLIGDKLFESTKSKQWGETKNNKFGDASVLPRGKGKLFPLAQRTHPLFWWVYSDLHCQFWCKGSVQDNPLLYFWKEGGMPGCDKLQCPS